MGCPQWVKGITLHLTNYECYLQIEIQHEIYIYIYTMEWTTKWLYNYIQKNKEYFNQISSETSIHEISTNKRDNLR